MKKIYLIGLLFLGIHITNAQKNTVFINHSVDKRDTLYMNDEVYIKFKAINLPKTFQVDNFLIAFPVFQKHNLSLHIESVISPFYYSASKSLNSVIRVKLKKTMDANTLIQLLKDEKNDLEYVEKVPIMKIFATPPNDPSFNTQWALSKINAQGAWDTNLGSNIIKVAVVDNAIQTTHPDLAANMVAGYDVADNDNDPNPPNTDFSHGTHVSGIVGAVTNNNLGIASLNYSGNIKIMPIKVTKDAEYFNSITYGYEGIAWAVANGAKVVNMSWGGGGYSQTQKSIIYDAIAQGVVLVAAAGNNNLNMPFYPAAYDGVITIASSDINDKKSSFSNYGNWIDVTSPGSGIYSTIPSNTYATFNGTSMASPLAASLCSYILSIKPNLSPSEVEFILKMSADNIDNLNTGYIGQLGAGRINAYKAILLTNNYCSTPLNPTLVTSGATTFCNGKSVLLQIGSPQIDWHFQWYKNGELLYGDTLSALTIKKTGLYAVNVSNGNCSKVLSQNVTVTPIEVFTINEPPTVCSPTIIDLTSTNIIGNSSRLSNYTKTYWKDANCTSPLITPSAISQRGTYYVKADSSGCLDIKPISIGIVNSTIPILNAQIQCDSLQTPLWVKDLSAIGSIGMGLSDSDGSNHFIESDNYKTIPLEDGALLIGTDSKLIQTAIKIDTLGQQIWVRKYEKGEISLGKMTDDGGFLLFCSNDSRGVVIRKVDSLGIISWEKKHANWGNGWTSFKGLVELPNKNGYAILSADWMGKGGGTDYQLTKIDKKGNVLWQKGYGGSNFEFVYEIKITADNGFCLLGTTASTSGSDFSEASRGYLDIWLVKTDSLGNKLWDKRYGGAGDEIMPKMINTTNGFLIASSTNSNVSGDVTSVALGDRDIWLFEIDNSGNKLWEKRYGGTLTEVFFSITPTYEGYLLGITSNSLSSGNLLSTPIGLQDFGILKVDFFGNLVWYKRLGYPNTYMNISNIQHIAGGDLFLTGIRTIGNSSQSNIWVSKLQLCPTLLTPVCVTPNTKVVLSALNCLNGNIQWSNGQAGNFLTINNAANNSTYTANCQIGGCSTKSKNILLNHPVTLTQTANSGQIATIQASEYLDSQSKLLALSKVTYTAGKSILLKPGFESNINSVFKAYIAGCQNLVIPNLTLAPMVCIPPAPNSSDFFIDGFSCLNVNNQGSGMSANGYGDFTSLKINAIIGDNIPFKINNKRMYNSNTIWVDLNNDGIFDDSKEKLAQTGSFSQYLISSVFKIPESTDIGIKRLRIRNSNSNPINPCDNDGISETEDYTLEILGGGSPSIIKSCIPLQSLNSSVFYINDVILANMSNLSNSKNPNTLYQDFTSGNQISLLKEINYNIIINTPPSNWASNINVGVWIDLNGDGIMLDNERQIIPCNSVFDSTVGANLNKAEGTIRIPSSTPLGTKRMRIRMYMGGYSIDSCNYNDYVYETEDYLINVN